MNSTIKKIIIVLLRLVSRAILWRHKPIVVAITGSVGKTTTKDVVGHGLTSVEFTRSADKSFNSDFGVPLTVINASNPWGKVTGWFDVLLQGLQVLLKDEYPKILVLEVGTRFPGDIERLAKWLKPHISLITHIPEVPVHIEFFGSRQAIIDEKSMLAKYTRAGGSIVLNHDSEYVYEIAKNMTHPVVTIGFHPDATYRAFDVQRVVTEDGQYGMRFSVKVRGIAIPVFAPAFIAKHQIYGVLYAMATADVLGYDISAVAASMSSLKPTVGRLNPLVGMGNTLIIDDSYNASPAAMEAAIETLTTIDTPGRHIAVLGDMLDLGKMTKEVHESVGTFLQNQRLDFIYLVGQRMRYAYDTMIAAKYPKTKIFYCDTPADVLPLLLKKIQKGDTILIKGSQGMRMEKIVAELVEDKENIEHNLVRQDVEWKKR